MSDEKPNDSIEKQSNSITIKKSSYNKIIAGFVAAVVVTAFISGYSLGTMDSSDSLSGEEMKEMIAEINKNAAPTPAPSIQQAPAQPTILKTVSLDDDPVKGDPNAPVTIVEFSDFQCPFCSRFYSQTLPQLEQNYIDTGKVKLVYRDYPLAFHQNAESAHIASECADEQDMFWEYHDVLFEKQTEWQSLGLDLVNERFLGYAQELGIEESSFTSCLGSSEIKQEIQADFAEGSQYGATGTPTFFVGNDKTGYTKITGAQPYSNFVNVIDAKLDS